MQCSPLGPNKHHDEWNTDTNISTGQEKEKNSGRRYKKTEKTGDNLNNWRGGHINNPCTATICNVLCNNFLELAI